MTSHVGTPFFWEKIPNNEILRQLPSRRPAFLKAYGRPKTPAPINEMKMFIPFLKVTLFSGLSHDVTILTGQGAQVFFLLLLLKGSDKRMKVEILLTAFHWRL